MTIQFCDQVAADEVSEICSWVTSSQELEWISGECGNTLRPSVLAEWIETSQGICVLHENLSPIGFVTITRAELELPSDTVEACHLIVRPDKRRIYYGTQLLGGVRRMAKQLGFSRAIGRIVPDNHSAQEFVVACGWVILHVHEFSPEFIWYSRGVSDGKVEQTRTANKALA